MSEGGNNAAQRSPSGLASSVTHAREFVGSRWVGLSGPQRLRVVWAIAALLAGVGAFAWWAMRPNWKTLYTGLSADDARQIGTALTAANLTYDVSSDGSTLRVPLEQLDKARLTTAGKAGGKAGRAGFELFDKPDWAGSDFDEKVNYQRALEGELEHTIDTLDDVQSSRVHLVLAHDSLFAESQREAKASVVLNLKGRRLSGTESEAVKNLVASAVEDLSPDHVVLMGADGQALAGLEAGSNAKTVYEQTLSQRILDTLEPVVGVGNVRATVNVDYDLAARDEVDENYDPAAVVTLSMQRAEQVAGGAAVPAGVPGTASNAPNQQTPLFPPSKSDGQSSKQESGTYGASKKTRHLTEGPGSISRITAAILVNDRQVPGADKKKASQSQGWTPEQLKQFSALSEAAVGFQESRGDKVIVQNLRFDLPATPGNGGVEKLLRQAGWAEPLIKDLLIGVGGLILLFMMIKPALKIVRQMGSAPPRQLAPGQRNAPGVASAAGPGAFQDGPQGAFDQVVAHIQRDPVQSTRVLQTWIRAE